MHVAALARNHAPPPVPLAAPTRAAARTLMVTGLAAILVAALTWRVADAGVGWLLADVVMVVALLAGVGRGRPGGAAWLLGLSSVWLAGATCWHASDWVIAIALPGSVGTLAALGLACARRASLTGLSDVPAAAFDALRSLPGGIADAARLPAQALDVGARGHALGVLRGLLLGAPIALLFVGLLAANGAFRHAVSSTIGRAGDGLDFTLWTGATACVLLVAHTVLRRVRNAGSRPPLDAPPAFGPYRVEGDLSVPVVSPGRTGTRLRPLTWGVVLGQVVAVFGIYVAANADSLFVGHAHLRARGTLTYASYLHEGFTQVSVAALLAVALVVLGHVLMRPREGGPVAGGRSLSVVELALLGLVGVTLASCAHRLSLYEEAYGYTYLRLGVWLMQLGVAGLLAMTGARCVARAWQGWGSALAWSAVCFTMFAGSFDADGWIARRNVERARAGAQLDTEYLAALSEDARAVLPEVASMDRDAADILEHAWAAQASAHRHHGWRSRRGMGAR
jgi:two-component system sensor histidine kinase BaeS